MKVLLDERNIVKALSSNIEFGVWGNVNNFASWKIGATQYMMDDNYTAVEVATVPRYVMPDLYYYENGKFILNEECPNEYKERVAAIEEQLLFTDEASVVLFEGQMAQEEVNIEQSEAIVTIFELIENQ